MKMTEANNSLDKVEQFKCPNCGGSIEFDSNIQRMKCPYCDSTFDMQTSKEFNDIQDSEDIQPEWEAYDVNSGNGDWQEEEKNQIKRYVCQSCGGEILTDATTVASACPYCDSPVVIVSELEGVYRPDMVIPFALDKKAAKQALTDFLKGKKLLPNCFKDKNHIEEIKGVYVPFWLYDCSAKGKAVFSATRVRHWSDSNYNYTKTDHFAVHRGGEMDFIKVPADGSQKMEDTLMESIEPYDYSKAMDFQTAYLSGYLAEKYDVSSEQNQERINKRISSSLIEMFEGTIHAYHTCMINHQNIGALNGKIQYALLPVWMLRTKYKGETYIFAMNGQTGKFVGDLPIDKAKAMKYFMGVFSLCAVLGTVISLFI